jgi:hypothetical protein
VSALAKNLHGAIAALIATRGDDVPTEEVVDMIERRFGIAPATAGKDTTRAALDRCVFSVEAALEHLRPDTIDWFKQRLVYVLQQAKVRQAYETSE